MPSGVPSRRIVIFHILIYYRKEFVSSAVHCTKQLLLDGKTATESYSPVLTGLLSCWPEDLEVSKEDLQLYITPFACLPESVVEDTQYNPFDYSDEKLYNHVFSSLEACLQMDEVRAPLCRHLLTDPYLAFQWLRGTYMLTVVTMELPNKGLRDLLFVSITPVATDTEGPLYLSSSFVVKEGNLRPTLTLPDSFVFSKLVAAYWQTISGASQVTHSVDITALYPQWEGMSFAEMQTAAATVARINSDGNATVQLQWGGIPLRLPFE